MRSSHLFIRTHIFCSFIGFLGSQVKTKKKDVTQRHNSLWKGILLKLELGGEFNVLPTGSQGLWDFATKAKAERLKLNSKSWFNSTFRSLRIFCIRTWGLPSKSEEKAPQKFQHLIADRQFSPLIHSRICLYFLLQGIWNSPKISKLTFTE